VYGAAVQPERAKELLARERARIERALRDVGVPLDDEELSPQNDQHLADHATETYQDSYDQGLAAQLRDELAALERAEHRLADGKYGLSVESGDPIPDERLEAYPLAERTVEEQGRFEGP
jgi:DnaK suppressor protein